MRNEAVEILFFEIEELLNSVTRRRLSENECNSLQILEDVLLSDAPIHESYFSIDNSLYHLFRTARINRYPHVKSLELISFPEGDIDVLRVEWFTNMLYERLKDKTIGQGRFNNADLNRFNMKSWAGKLWVDYKSGSVISLTQEKGFLVFSIISRP